jgi:RNA polymerase sigma-70 factor (ECF subfamily)
MSRDDAAESERSFDHFFAVEYERLLRAMYLVVGDQEEAEDLVQDAFVEVLERWSSVEGMASPTGYLYRTAMNGFRTRYRRTVMAVRRIALLAPRRHHLFDEVEIQADIRDALSALSPRQRAAIVLTELLGYGADDAAEILAIKPSTVRALTTQARARLRLVLGDVDA